MAENDKSGLSRRERQIMDILYRLGRASAADVQAAMVDTVSYSTVRAQLRVLEEKGHVRHEEQDLRYVYLPTVPREKAQRSALRHVMETFFDGSAEQMMAALLDRKTTEVSTDELERLSKLIDQARRNGR